MNNEEKEEFIEDQRKELIKESAILRVENKQLKAELRLANNSEEAWEAIAKKELEDKHFGGLLDGI